MNDANDTRCNENLGPLCGAAGNMSELLLKLARLGAAPTSPCQVFAGAVQGPSPAIVRLAHAGWIGSARRA